MYMGERDYDHAIQSFFQVGAAVRPNKNGRMVASSLPCGCMCVLFFRVSVLVLSIGCEGVSKSPVSAVGV